MWWYIIFSFLAFDNDWSFIFFARLFASVKLTCHSDDGIAPRGQEICDQGGERKFLLQSISPPPLKKEPPSPEKTPPSPKKLRIGAHPAPKARTPAVTVVPSPPLTPITVIQRNFQRLKNFTRLPLKKFFISSSEEVWLRNWSRNKKFDI